ncbi:MAG: hypothetical protein ACLRSW_13435 [Christensenellaceae bacterium]
MDATGEGMTKIMIARPRINARSIPQKEEYAQPHPQWLTYQQCGKDARRKVRLFQPV